MPHSLPVIYVGEINCESLRETHRVTRTIVVATCKIQSTDIEYIPARRCRDCVEFKQSFGPFNREICFVTGFGVPHDGSGFCHNWREK